jgi:hypothetical protein
MMIDFGLTRRGRGTQAQYTSSMHKLDVHALRIQYVGTARDENIRSIDNGKWRQSD